MNRRCRQRIFAGTRHQSHSLNGLRQIGNHARIADPGRAHHLKGELWHPVAKSHQRQIFDHHIGDPAIGRRIPSPLHRLDLRVGQLKLAAGVDPHVQVNGTDLDAIGPNPPHPGNLALTQRNRQTDRIGKRGGRWLGRPLATARGRNAFQKPRRPDHLSADPHPPENPRHRAAFAGPGQAEPLDPAGFHRV